MLENTNYFDQLFVFSTTDRIKTFKLTKCQSHIMDWKTLSPLSPGQIKLLQGKKLRYFLQHKIPFSQYYNKLLDKLGMETELKEKRIIDNRTKT